MRQTGRQRNASVVGAIRLAFTAGMLFVLSGCSNFYKAQNTLIDEYRLAPSYRTKYFNQVHPPEENLIILAFSGGGTRAAALSYGVMQELRDTRFSDDQGKERTLLSDVDFISSVSGGSFTAAYYAAFGDKLFEDYERRFLRQSIEGALLANFLSPSHWLKSLWTAFDRTEMAVEYYDTHIFRGMRFGDIPLHERPYVIINATDLSMGSRFVFDQDMFDMLCADLSDFPLARAVTASSAVPVAFPSVVLKNRAGQCDLDGSETYQMALDLQPSTVRQKEYSEMVQAYQVSNDRQYVHLVDGGISDNLGLRALSDQIEIFGLEKTRATQRVKRIIVILVNSSVKPARAMDKNPESPSISETLDAFTSALIERYTTDTKSYFFDEKSEFEQRIREVDPDVEFYLTEVSFESLEQSDVKTVFNRLPTSLELDDEQIDSLIAAGRGLLRNDKTFKHLKRALNANLVVSEDDSDERLLDKVTRLLTLDRLME
jgi:NTE family protein